MTQKSPQKEAEVKIQADAFQWTWNYCPQTRYLFFAVPLGGYRSKIEAMQFKASGAVAGIPDMILLWQGKAFGFEFKTPTGTLQPIQKEVHRIWEGQQIPVWIVRSAEEFKPIFLACISK